MLTFKKKTFTPSMCAKLLATTELSGFNNRKPSPAFVERYTQDMRAGNWKADTGETIKIDDSGVVIDGSHRLNSIIAAGIPVTIWVCEGIKKGMFQYIDQGNTRNLEDIMSIKKWEDPSVLAATGKMLWRQSAAGDPFARVRHNNESDGNIYDWIVREASDLRPEWVSYSEMIKKAHLSNMKSIPKSLLFYMLYIWKKVDSNTAHLFLGYLSGGPAAIPPHNAMAFFKQYALEMLSLKREGKYISNGRMGDMKAELLQAAQYAFELAIMRKKSISYNGFKGGLGKRKKAIMQMEKAA